LSQSHRPDLVNFAASKRGEIVSGTRKKSQSHHPDLVNSNHLRFDLEPRFLQLRVAIPPS